LHALSGEFPGQEVLQEYQTQAQEYHQSIAAYDGYSNYEYDWESWTGTSGGEFVYGYCPVMCYVGGNNDWTDVSKNFQVADCCKGTDDNGGETVSETDAPDSEEGKSEATSESGEAWFAEAEIRSEVSNASLLAMGISSDKGVGLRDEPKKYGSGISQHRPVPAPIIRMVDYSGFWRPDVYMNLSHKVVPRKADFTKPEFEKSGSSSGGDTTMMLRNLPNEYTRKMLMNALDKCGFRGTYDFIYLPIDKCTHWNVGYAFVNFLCPDVAERCKQQLSGHRFPSEDPRPEKVTQVCRAHVQGLEKNVEYYKRSAVMTSRHESHRPLIIPGGVLDESDSSSRPCDSPDAMPLADVPSALPESTKEPRAEEGSVEVSQETA
jgi:hypothetical protein